MRELAIEHAQLEILDLEDQVRDISAERDVYRSMAQAAIHLLHAAQIRDQRRRKLIRQQTDLIRELRGSFPSAPALDWRAA